MKSIATSGAEEHIRHAFDAGNLDVAVTTLLEAYGSGIFSFLVARLRDPDFASEVFGDFAEDAWRGIASFRWDCSAKGWAYTLARHAASRALRQRRRNAAQLVPLSRAESISQIADRVSSQTSKLWKAERRSRMAALREQLPVYEQLLLMLRVNRELPWREIARVLAAGSLEEVEALTADQLDAEATRHRKRFQKAKERLRKMALEAGLLSE